MSVLQGGAYSVNCSSPGIVVTGSGATGRGTLVAVAADAGLVKVFDSNVSTTAAKLLGLATANSPFEPPVPIFYRQGLYANASGANAVVVAFIPHGAG